jgi:hypothetical protein
MRFSRPFRPDGDSRLGRLRRWAGTRRGTTVLVTLALVSALALPTVAQQWVGAGHKMPKLPPESAFLPAAPKSGDCQYFPETQHNLCGEFRAYWNRTGGLMIHGYPLTEEYYAPELGVVTQWFERSRLEFHPYNPPEFRVLQGHVSREILAMLQAGWTGTPGATPTPSQTSTPTPAEPTRTPTPVEPTRTPTPTPAPAAVIRITDATGSPIIGPKLTVPGFGATYVMPIRKAGGSLVDGSPGQLDDYDYDYLRCWTATQHTHVARGVRAVQRGSVHG